MDCGRLSRIYAGDVVVAVYGDVQREIYACQIGYLAYGVVNGVADRYSPPCFRMSQSFQRYEVS